MSETSDATLRTAAQALVDSDPSFEEHGVLRVDADLFSALRAALSSIPEQGRTVGGYWWCPECKEEVDSSRVTYTEKHDACGRDVEWVPRSTLPPHKPSGHCDFCGKWTPDLRAVMAGCPDCVAKGGA